MRAILNNKSYSLIDREFKELDVNVIISNNNDNEGGLRRGYS